MKKSEEGAVVRLVRHMKKLQAQIARPETSDATEEEVRTIIGLLWEWTQTPNQKLPSKHVMENLVGLFRGCGDREYCYISRGGLAAVVFMYDWAQHLGTDIDKHIEWKSKKNEFRPYKHGGKKY